jgi:UDP-glucuronate decarboxylase
MGIMEQQESVGPVNLGNPTEFTIRQLAEAVLQKVETPSKIVEKPLPADDPTQRKPDIALAQKIMSWEPKMALPEGLDRTIPYFREIIEA